MNKINITAAITGSIHTPSMSPYLPITPEQIADEAIKAGEAGAAIVHIHVRDPETGKPSSDLNLFREVIERIRKRSDVIICLTTGGGVGMTLEERIKVVPVFKPELASLNMGTLNFALHRSIGKIKDFKYRWERDYMLMSKSLVFKNSFEDLEFFCKTMYEEGVKPELECYDVGHLYNVAYLIREGILKTPIYIQFVMGVLGGIGSEIEQLVHLKRTADSLFKENYVWSVVGAGMREFTLCTAAAAMGSHGVRVGLEDNLYLRKGQLARSNAELVKKVASLIYEVAGREAATPDEARNLFGIRKIQS